MINLQAIKEIFISVKNLRIPLDYKWRECVRFKTYVIFYIKPIILSNIYNIISKKITIYNFGYSKTNLN